MSKGKLFRITWGASFANTLNLGYPLDNWNAYSNPRDGSVFVQVESGERDSWVIGTDYYLTGDVRWIPTANTTNPLATGFDGTTGVRTFLEWARAMNSFRFFPDASSGTFITSFLTEPANGASTLEADGTRSIRMTITNATNPYDGY